MNQTLHSDWCRASEGGRASEPERRGAAGFSQSEGSAGGGDCHVGNLPRRQHVGRWGSGQSGAPVSVSLIKYIRMIPNQPADQMTSNTMILSQSVGVATPLAARGLPVQQSAG